MDSCLALLKSHTVTHVTLDDNPKLTDYRPLLDSANFPALQFLSLAQNKITDAMLLSAAPLLNTSHLKTLHLWNNLIGNDGAKALAEV